MIDSFRDDYFFLSNYFTAPIEENGVTYPTNEHYFHAHKSSIVSQNILIAHAATPGEAKRLGRKCKMRPDWNTYRLEVMRNGIHLKFTQHPELAEKLLATGNEELIEGNTWNDKFWGVCDGVGENNLGKILMEERERLKNDNSK